MNIAGAGGRAARRSWRDLGWERWRGVVRDVAVATVVTWLNLFEAVYAPPGPLLRTTRAMVAVTVAAGATLLLRRRFPLAVTVIALVADAVGRTVLVQMVALYTLASSRRGRRGQVAVLAAGAVAALLVVAHNHNPVGALSWVGLLVALPIAVGSSVATRRALTEGLMEKTARLEREHELLAERARSEERARVAREMHDLVAHRMSLVVLHAGALEVGPAARDPEVAEAATLIRSIGQQALQELRQVVGLLRFGGQDTPSLAPQPRLADVEELVAHSRAAGLDVTLHVEGAPPTLDQRVERALYRLVQESLTNVHRHGATAAAEVSLRFGVTEVEVTVTNPAGVDGRVPGSPAGTGLVGLRERVELLGGTFDAGPGDGCLFRVHARIPRSPREVAG